MIKMADKKSLKKFLTDHPHFELFKDEQNREKVPKASAKVVLSKIRSFRTFEKILRFPRVCRPSRVGADARSRLTESHRSFIINLLEDPGAVSRGRRTEKVKKKISTFVLITSHCPTAKAQDTQV